MKLAHTTPCNECPWRRVHPAGWLGGYTIDDFINQVQHDGPPVPCHKTIPTGGEARAPCAGALIFMRNSCKSAQHPDYGDMLEQVSTDTVNVFQWPQEFRDHHSDFEGWAKRAVARMKAAR